MTEKSGPAKQAASQKTSPSAACVTCHDGFDEIGGERLVSRSTQFDKVTLRRDTDVAKVAKRHNGGILDVTFWCHNLSERRSHVEEVD